MKKLIYIGIGLCVLLFLIHLLEKYFTKQIPYKSTLKFKAPSTMDYIAKLHPTFRPVVEKFITEIESPKNGNQRVLITSGTRSFDKQALLAAGEGNTNIKVSLHNFGFAIDINVTGTDKSGKTVALKLATPDKDWNATVVPIAKKLGMTWGGDFKNTPTPDRVHFSYGGEPKAKQYLALLNDKKIDKNGFVIV